MKKLVILAVLIFAALIMKAQSPADSVSVMLRHLQTTNAELVRVNENVKLHGLMVAGGGAVMTAGLLYATKRVGNFENAHLDETRVRTGLLVTAAGAAIVVASVIPLAKKGVTLDERGLVVHPSELRKK